MSKRKPVWEVTCSIGVDLYEHLRDGWEPYAVTTEPDKDGFYVFTYHLRRKVIK